MANERDHCVGGANDYGQLGLGNSERYYVSHRLRFNRVVLMSFCSQLEPKLLSRLRGERVVKIASGDYHSEFLSA